MIPNRCRRGRILLRVVVFVVLLGIGVVLLLASTLALAYQGFPTPVILDFPKGTSTQQMADQLADAGVVRYPWQFVLARLLHPAARLQAGEYQFTHPDTTWNVFNRIVRGDIFFYQLTVPEGSNMFDIAGLLKQFDFLNSDEFLKAARDPSLIRDLAPNAPTLEGYLFPSTYRLTRRTTVRDLCQMMTDQFRRHWKELQKPHPAVPVNDTVILASLVEKETAIPAERPLVASVFENRLRLGMPLDCDPTTIYSALLDQRYHGTIYKSDLESTNPYNTYQHAGLPPGPIANPGVASLKAALAPATSDYLYFVAKADGSGGHQFSKTMDEHNRAVQSYRRTIRQPDPPPPPPAPHANRRHARKA
ncbi:MAG TPA: endolytic transglycosylase MltG [Bryobacteraceae bacterium]|nr:endolytic transglycosylase MltG [Bryobacteraceae bacterium]